MRNALRFGFGYSKGSVPKPVGEAYDRVDSQSVTDVLLHDPASPEGVALFHFGKKYLSIVSRFYR